MLKFWIITVVQNIGRDEATFVRNNRVYTDKKEAHADWDSMPQDSNERVELWECIGNLLVAEK